MKNKKHTLPCKAYLLENTKNNTHLNNIVQPFDADFLKFAHTIVSKDNELVCLDNIVGTTHSDYFGSSWIMLFDKILKRNSSLNCISKLDTLNKKENTICNVQYYIEGEEYRKYFYQSREWGVYVINEKEAYISEGNHRSVIAKFLSKCNLIPDKIIFPYVNYIYYDMEALEKYKSTKTLLDNIKRTQEHIEYVSLDMERELLSTEYNTKNFALKYKLYIKIDRKNTPIYKVFNNMDTLLFFLNEVINDYTPRPFYAKFYRFINRLLKLQQKY